MEIRKVSDLKRSVKYPVWEEEKRANPRRSLDFFVYGAPQREKRKGGALSRQGKKETASGWGGKKNTP